MIVCVNKIESVNYDETVFEEIKSELSLFLKRVGYNPAKIPFVPVSALGGECISERTD